jgi:hypothetical protein
MVLMGTGTGFWKKVTEDEKCVKCDNVIQKRQWHDVDEQPNSKSSIHVKALVLGEIKEG